MKKTISILLTVILITIIYPVAIAEEDFILRNGIVFGDTLEDVKQKETLTIRSSSVDKTNNVWFEGKIAGMDGSVRFDFDEGTGKLIDMLYEFNSSSKKDFIDSDYSTLKKGLIRKYGNPLGNTGGSLHLITGPAVESSALMIILYQYINGSGDIRDYDEWVIESNGYNVKIDLMSFYTRDDDYNYTYYNYLSYHYYTDDDYLNAVQEKIDENTAVDNDL